MEQTAADAPVPAGEAALHPHRPPRPVSAGLQHPAGSDGDQVARGEHVHSEPTAPVTGAGRTGGPEQAGKSGQPGESRPPGGRPARFHQTRAARRPTRHSVRAQVLSSLREALVSGELAPGEVYSAPALAERLGVSATPVREAMQRLVCEGAVETVPNRGFRVAVCSDRDVAELAEIRILLEIPSVLETARAMPPECWESLRPYADEALAVAGDGDRAAYADADCAFHRALLHAAALSRNRTWGR